MDMGTLTEVLKALGAADDAIAYMGPVLTAVMAWFGSYVITQTVKFPLAHFVKDPFHREATRYLSITVAFLLAHYLSNHLSVLMEVIVACAQPVVYAVCLATIGHFAPWIKVSWLGGVSPALTSRQ